MPGIRAAMSTRNAAAMCTPAGAMLSYETLNQDAFPPLCDIPSGCCSFTGPWTVTRSSLRMLRWVTAFCRPLRPVLLLVSFPRSRSPVVGVLGLPPPPPPPAWCQPPPPPPPHARSVDSCTGAMNVVTPRQGSPPTTWMSLCGNERQ